MKGVRSVKGVRGLMGKADGGTDGDYTRLLRECNFQTFLAAPGLMLMSDKRSDKGPVVQTPIRTVLHRNLLSTQISDVRDLEHEHGHFGL